MLRNTGKLRGTRIYVQNDYSAETLRKRKLLWQEAKRDMEAGKRVTLIHEKLRVDNQFYTWDDASNSRKIISPVAASTGDS